MKVYVDASPSELVCVPETGVPYCEILVGKTDSEAKYLAVIRALEKFPNTTEILSDSEVVIRQINTGLGKSNIAYACGTQNLKSLLHKVLELCKDNVTFIHIPRKQNPAGRLLG